MRIATWNVENLFLPGGESGPPTAEVYEAKLDGLAASVRAMAPDVLALQEIGEEQALDDLAERIGGTWYRRVAEADARGIRVAVLSRVPVETAGETSAFPARVRPVQVDDAGTTAARTGRSLLHLGVVLDGERVDLLVCHLKSKLLSYPDDRFNPRDEDERARYGAYALFRRAAEAATARTAATRLLGGAGTTRAVVVLGDLNDEPQASTTQMLLGPPGSEIGTGGYDVPDRGDAERLWNLAPRIPPAQRYTRVYRGRAELIDHVLVSRALVTRVRDGDVTTDAGGTLPATASVTDDPTRRLAAPASDHRPVLAVIERAAAG